MPTDYTITHVTRFAYASPVGESVMELRMRPATEGVQQCRQFDVDVQPRASVFSYRDFLGNWVHHFDQPRRHVELSITARAQVQIATPQPWPASLPISAWDAADEWVEQGEHWDFRQPSRFAEWTAPLIDFADSLGGVARRAHDPLTTVRETMAALHREFEYAPQSTRVDSSIDEALAARRGVCQDFSHILLATLRRYQLPCRYVSGYLAPSAQTPDASVTVATHAWVEVMLPEIGWIGVDATNALDAGARHIRVAVGRDYADVPPARGVFKGGASSTLSVSVEIRSGAAMASLLPASLEGSWTSEPAPLAPLDEERQKQRQQQQ